MSTHSINFTVSNEVALETVIGAVRWAIRPKALVGLLHEPKKAYRSFNIGFRGTKEEAQGKGREIQASLNVTDAHPVCVLRGVL